MVKRAPWFGMILVGMSAWASIATAQGNSATKLIVAGFETNGSVGLSAEEYDALGLALTAILTSELSQRTGAATVAFGPSLPARGGRIDLSAARARAASLGATTMLVGSLLDEYGDVHLEIRILPVVAGPPSAVIKSATALSKREQISDAAVDLSDGIVAALNTSLPARGVNTKRNTVPVDAMLHFGRGLIFEVGSDRIKAAEAYRAALKVAPGFAEATVALQRVGGL